MREAVCLTDADGTVLSCNRAYASLVGRSPEEAKGRNCCTLLHGESHAPSDCPLVRMSKSRRREEGEVLVDGRWMRFAVDPVFDGKGKLVGAVHLVSDVTERKRIEEALREAELEFRTLAESASVGILLVQDGRFTYANAVAEAITGYGAAELTGMRFLDAVHPEFRDLVRARAEARLRGTPGLPSRYEIKIVTKAGKERWLDLTSAAVSIHGEPGMVATIADVTEERRLRQVQSAIYEISQATQTAGDLQELYRSIHAVIGRLMEARNFYIALYDAEANLVSFPYFVDEYDQAPQPFPPGKGMTSYVLRTGRSLLATPEVLKDLEERGAVESLGAASIDWLGVPLVLADRTVGVLAVQAYAGGVRYTREDEEILTHVSREVAVAIERKRSQDLLAATNARLVREAAERAKAEELRAAIYEIAEAAQQVPSLEELFVAVHKVVGRFMDASSFFIALYDSERNLLTFPYYRSSAIEPPAPFPPGKGLTSHVLRTGKALLGTPEVLDGFRRRRNVHTVGKPAVSWLGVPLTIGERVGGVLAVQSFSEAARYDEGDMKVLAFMSGQIAAAIERKRAVSALQTSEARYRTLFEAAHDAIILTMDGRCIDCNDRALEMYGCTREEMLGKSPAEYSPARQRDGTPSAEAAAAHISAALAGEPQSFEWLHRKKDGTPFMVEVALKRLVVGEDTYLLSIVRDITARKRDEEARRESDERYRAFFEQAPIGIYQATPEGRLLGANPALIAMLKYESFADLAALDLGARGFQLGRQGSEFGEMIARQGEARDLKSVWTAKDGTPVYVRESARAIRRADGEVLYYEGTVEDITRSMASEIERQRLSQAVEQAAETVVITDTEGRIQYVNPAFERISGYSRAEAIGQDLSLLKSGRHDDAYYASMWQAIRSGETWHGRFVNRRKDGALYEEDATISPIRDNDGGIVSFVAVKRDITQEVALEGQLRQAQKMEAIGHLAGGVAHDFNNLLQAMLSHTQVLRAHLLDPERILPALDELGQQIQHGAALTRQLLLFSRRETTKRERVSLNETVRETTQVLRRLVRANISLVTDLADGALLVEGDRRQLQQVLMNLALNASDAMPGGGSLEVRTGAGTAGEVWLAVSDTGRGIPDDARDHIFEPFFTTKEAGKGTGLGLSVVHGIVTGHGGRVEFETTPGRGSTFKVTLPAVSPGESEEDRPSPPLGGDLALGRGERILVVEDERGAREGIRDLLLGIGYQVTTVASGEDARPLPQEPPFDLLLTDVMLPGIGGAHLAEELLKRWPSLKVVLMSGYAKDDALRSDVFTGAVRFLQKPFDIATLAAEVRDALDEGGKPHG